MANLVIVTKQCYLLCQSINYIAVGPIDDEKKWDIGGDIVRRKKKRLTAAEKALLKEKDPYQISIEYVPVPGNPNSNSNSRSSDGVHNVAIIVVGEKRCMALFQDMIDQIRNQMPDHLFLDRLVEKFLADCPVDK